MVIHWHVYVCINIDKFTGCYMLKAMFTSLYIRHLSVRACELNMQFHTYMHVRTHAHASTHTL